MAELPDDAGKRIMALFIKELEHRLTEKASELKAADFEMIRKLMADNSITLASVQRGDFGETARQVAESFPFDEEGAPTFQ
jgi:hypothetical protein